MLEVGVGLAVGHRPPRPRREQVLRQLADGREPADLARTPSRSLSSRSSWWRRIALARSATSVNGWPWAGSTIVTPSSSVIRSSEAKNCASGSLRRADAGDVRRDRRQHVVARQQHALGGVEQAQVVGGVARRVHRHPLAPASVTISASSTRRVGRGAGKRLLLRISSNRFRRSGSGMYSSPPHGVARHGFGAASSSGVSSSVGSHQVRKSSWVMSSAPTSLSHPARAAEVIGVGVGDDHRVHPSEPCA